MCPRTIYLMYFFVAITPGQVLFCNSRSVFLTRLLTTAPRLWLSHLLIVSTPPSRCQNTAPASTRAELPSTTPLLQRKSRLTGELALSHLLVASRSSTHTPHKLSSGETCYIACSQLVRHPSRASRKAPLGLGGALANRPLYKLPLGYA